MSGCEKPQLEPDSTGMTASSTADQKVKEKKGNGKNPFSVANMKQAYANLLLPPSDCIGCDPTIFRGLQPDITTVRGYQAKVNAQNNGVQAAQLEQLVTSYRW